MSTWQAPFPDTDYILTKIVYKDGRKCVARLISHHFNIHDSTFDVWLIPINNDANIILVAFIPKLGNKRIANKILREAGFTDRRR